MRLHDRPFFVDHVGDPPGVFALLRIRCPVRKADLSLRIAEERKGKPELFGETPILFRRIEAHAEDFRVLRLVLLDEVPEPGTLKRSTRCVRFRIEPEHHLAAVKLAQSDAVSFMIGDIEVRSFLTALQHVRFPSEDQLKNPFQRHAGMVSQTASLHPLEDAVVLAVHPQTGVDLLCNRIPPVDIKPYPADRRVAFDLLFNVLIESGVNSASTQ
jgi:hypothetical protein